MSFYSILLYSILDGSGDGGISFQRLQQQSMEDILSLGGDNNMSASSSA